MQKVTECEREQRIQVRLQKKTGGGLVTAEKYRNQAGGRVLDAENDRA